MADAPRADEPGDHRLDIGVARLTRALFLHSAYRSRLRSVAQLP
jgi:hypothetical protein